MSLYNGKTIEEILSEKGDQASLPFKDGQYYRCLCRTVGKIMFRQDGTEASINVLCGLSEYNICRPIIPPEDIIEAYEATPTQIAVLEYLELLRDRHN